MRRAALRVCRKVSILALALAAFQVVLSPVADALPTDNGVHLVRDIDLVGVGSSPSSYTQAGQETFFVAKDDVMGLEFWKTDGTVSGTRAVEDIREGSRGSRAPPAHGPERNGVLHRERREQRVGVGRARASLRTPSSSRILPGPHGSSSNWLTVEGGTMYFNADDLAPRGAALEEQRDRGRDRLVPDANPGQAGSCAGIAHRRERHALLRRQRRRAGWSSGRATARHGHVLVKDIDPGPQGSFPSSLVDLGGTLLFTADDGLTGNELSEGNGTAAGTTLVRDISDRSSSPQGLMVVGDRVYFSPRAMRRAVASCGGAMGPSMAPHLSRTSNRDGPTPIRDGSRTWTGGSTSRRTNIRGRGPRAVDE